MADPANPQTPVRSSPVKSADRAVELLEWLASADRRLTLTELHHALSYPKSSLYMLLQTLVLRGWVEEDHGCYGIGVRALLAGTSYLDKDPVVRIAVPIMERLRREVDETVHLARLDGTDIVYLASRESEHHLRVSSRVGRRLPAYSTSLGKALLACKTGAEREAHVPAALDAITPSTVTDRAELFAQLDAFRTQGYAFEREENAPGLCCFGVALDYTTPPIDALSCSVPVARLDEQHRKQIVASLVSAARGIVETYGRQR